MTNMEKGKFINDLHKNAFDETNGEDAVKHIEYFLRIVDPIDLPYVNQDKLRVVVFPVSLSDEDETAEIFRIETNLFDYETSLCEEFKEINYLLKINPDLLTKTLKDLRLMRITKMTGSMNGIKHTIGNMPGAYIIGNSLHYQDYEWYEALEEGELKDEALRNKDSNHDHEEQECMDEHDVNDEELFDHAIQEQAVCLIKRYVMIKYSFWDDEKYVAIREEECNDSMSRNEEACQAYQEIFRMMDNGWTVTRTE
ncbi:hypothetical protein Tco_1096750 [Tanacetum coccineum]